MRYSGKLSRPATLVSACVLAAWVLGIADAVQRSGWEFVPVGRHVAGALGLLTLVGTVIGLGLLALTAIERAITARVRARRPRFERVSRYGFYALIAGAASVSTAFWTFSGNKAQKSPVALVAPYVFILLIALGTAAYVALVERLERWLEQGKKLGPLLGATGLALLAVALIYVDLTVFVALYARLHTLLEIVAFTIIATLWALFLKRWLGRQRIGRHFTLGLAGLGALWLLLTIAISPLRSWRDRALRHVWLEPAYAARALSRVQTSEAFLRNPLAWRGVAESRMDELKRRYDITTTAVAPEWEEGLVEPKAVRDKLAALRGERRDYNVIVYYVDTLRADVAQDPGIMPHAVEFSNNALDFRHVYAAGSNTLHSLPALTSGSYEETHRQPGDILQVTKRAQMERVLVIPQSAYEFLNKLKPTFEFDQALQIWDYKPDKKDVWGYGGDQPTGERLVDRALEWLEKERKRRFLLWVFNFDQHNWRELDKDWVHATAAQNEVPDEHAQNWRYRVVATSIDKQFQRLLDGIHRLGLEQDTIVVFVSDHGEGLGRDGFWVHSIFLWECLLRVPLAIRVPGMGHQVIRDKVSLVDVAPTLARFIVEDPPLDGYHGEDLLTHLVPNRPPRRVPILASGVSQDVLSRVGVIDPDSRFKLVLPLEAGTPELYDVTVPDPDWENLSEEYPTETALLLSELVRSPIFPRSSDDQAAKEREKRAAAKAASAP